MTPTSGDTSPAIGSTPSSSEASVSVVIPARNAGHTIGRQLASLARQEWRPERFEVVVVDNGSTDRTAYVARSWVDRLPIRVVDAGEHPGLNVARNSGIRAAEGDVVLLVDADDEVLPGFLREMTIKAGEADVWGAVAVTPPSAPKWVARSEAPFLFLFDGRLLYVGGAAIGFNRSVFDHVQFDEQTAYGADEVSFSVGAQLAGFRIGLAADARFHYFPRDRRRAQIRRSYLHGRGQTRLRNSLPHRAQITPRGELLAIGKELVWHGVRIRSESGMLRMASAVARRAGNLAELVAPYETVGRYEPLRAVITALTRNRPFGQLHDGCLDVTVPIDVDVVGGLAVVVDATEAVDIAASRVSIDVAAMAETSGGVRSAPPYARNALDALRVVLTNEDVLVIVAPAAALEAVERTLARHGRPDVDVHAAFV